MLAYSSISHAGFLLIGLVGLYSANAQAPGTFTTYGMLSLVYYLINYCVTNLGAFAALALVGRALGGDEISDLKKELRQMLEATR